MCITARYLLPVIFLGCSKRLLVSKAAHPMKTIILLAGVLLLGGCVAPVQKSVQTRSGKPEVEIANGDVKKIKAVLIGAMVDHGFTLERDSDYLVEFTGVLTGGEQFTVAMTIGNSYSRNWKSYSFMFIPTETGIRVIGSCEVKAQLPGGRLNTMSLNDNGAVFNSIQMNLEGLKRKIEESAQVAKAS